MSWGLASSVWPSQGGGHCSPGRPKTLRERTRSNTHPQTPLQALLHHILLEKSGSVPLRDIPGRGCSGLPHGAPYGAAGGREGGARPLCSKTCWGHDAPQRPGQFSTSLVSASRAPRAVLHRKMLVSTKRRNCPDSLLTSRHESGAAPRARRAARHMARHAGQHAPT